MTTISSDQHPPQATCSRCSVETDAYMVTKERRPRALCLLCHKLALETADDRRYSAFRVSFDGYEREKARVASYGYPLPEPPLVKAQKKLQQKAQREFDALKLAVPSEGAKEVIRKRPTARDGVRAAMAKAPPIIGGNPLPWSAKFIRPPFEPSVQPQQPPSAPATRSRGGRRKPSNWIAVARLVRELNRQRVPWRDIEAQVNPMLGAHYTARTLQQWIKDLDEIERSSPS